MNRRFVILLLTLILCCFFGTGLRALTRIADNAIPLRGSEGKELGRFFFGSSNDPKLGKLAWLFYISRDGRSGQVFVPPHMLKFSKITVMGGGIEFQSEVFLGKYYRFRGTLHDSDIKGSMELVGTDTGIPESMWEITATQVRDGARNGIGSEEIPPIHFSSASYSEEGGDVVGADLRILWTENGTAGMVVFYESYWGEPTFIPLAMSNIKKHGSMIDFTMNTPDGSSHYYLRKKGNEAVFYRDNLKAQGATLKLVRSILPALSR